MRKTNLARALFALMLILLLALVACSNETAGDDDGTKDSDKGTGEGTDSDKDSDAEEKKGEDGLYSIEDFSPDKTNKGEAIEGGTLNFGLVSDTAFEGTLNWIFYDGDPDAQILTWFGDKDGLLQFDNEYRVSNEGAATYEVSEDGKTFTLTIRDNVNWHDGEPVTAEDLEFAYEVIGHPDYAGSRFGADFLNVVGMEEYHAGEADKISGIKAEGKKFKITFKESTPSLLTGGIWTYPLAKHIFKDIPVKKMAASPEVRENPIGYGPFKVESITPGESVVMTKNEDYWQGEPTLDKVVIQVINPDTVVQALETGKVDMVDSFPTDQYPANAEMSNVEYLGMVDQAYTYIGFKLGTWDKEKKQVNPNPDAKMANKSLRQAMWHAVDNDKVGEKFYHGLRWNATTLIPPSHPKYHDEENPGRTYDPEKAKQLLDEAGYKDTNDDGFREDPDGEELVINFASMSGGDTAEPLAKYYIQAWEAVGLKVELLNGRLLEFNTFYDKVGQGGNDDPEVDIYQGAWGVGYDVNPQGLYGRKALFNFSRYASEKNDELLAKGVSEKAFDVETRQKIYDEWQAMMVEDVPVFPTLYRAKLAPVNNRVQNYSIAIDYYDFHKIALTEEEPIAAE